MTYQQKNPSNEEPSRSSDYLIPVKNINAFMFSEPDVGYINGKIEDCDDNIVSFDILRNHKPERNISPKKQPDELEPPLFDISFHSSADTHSSQKGLNTSPPHNTDTPPHREHPLHTEPGSPENSEEVFGITILSNSPPFDYPDPSEVETYTDVSVFRSDSSPVPAGDTSVYYSNSPATIPQVTTEPPEFPSSDDFHVTIDEALEQIVCSDPFLSENDLLFLLQQESHGGFKLSRRLLKKKLVKNGLENSYKRFRAYIAG